MTTEREVQKSIISGVNQIPINDQHLETYPFKVQINAMVKKIIGLSSLSNPYLV